MFQGSFWKFHNVVGQNKGREIYKKSVLHVQSCFLLITPIDILAVFVAIAALHYTILYFV